MRNRGDRTKPGGPRKTTSDGIHRGAKHAPFLLADHGALQATLATLDSSVSQVEKPRI